MSQDMSVGAPELAPSLPLPLLSCPVSFDMANSLHCSLMFSVIKCIHFYVLPWNYWEGWKSRIWDDLAKTSPKATQESSSMLLGGGSRLGSREALPQLLAPTSEVAILLHVPCWPRDPPLMTVIFPSPWTGKHCYFESQSAWIKAGILSSKVPLNRPGRVLQTWANYCWKGLIVCYGSFMSKHGKVVKALISDSSIWS